MGQQCQWVSRFGMGVVPAQIRPRHLRRQPPIESQPIQSSALADSSSPSISPPDGRRFRQGISYGPRPFRSSLGGGRRCIPTEDASTRSPACSSLQLMGRVITPYVVANTGQSPARNVATDFPQNPDRPLGGFSGVPKNMRWSDWRDDCRPCKIKAGRTACSGPLGRFKGTMLLRARGPP